MPTPITVDDSTPLERRPWIEYRCECGTVTRQRAGLIVVCSHYGKTPRRKPSIMVPGLANYEARKR